MISSMLKILFHLLMWMYLTSRRKHSVGQNSKQKIYDVVIIAKVKIVRSLVSVHK